MSKLYTNGTFQAKTVMGAFGETKSGKPEFRLEFDLLDGPDKGRHITAMLSLVDGAFEITRRAMKACGWEEGTDPLGSTFDAEVSLVLIDETYNGETRTRVKFINEKNSSYIARNRLDPSKEQQMSKAFMARCQKSGITPKNGKPAVQSEFTGQTGHGDDEIPW